MASQMKVEAVIKQGASIVGYVIVNERVIKLRLTEVICVTWLLLERLRALQHLCVMARS